MTALKYEGQNDNWTLRWCLQTEILAKLLNQIWILIQKDYS